MFFIIIKFSWHSSSKLRCIELNVSPYGAHTRADTHDFSVSRRESQSSSWRNGVLGLLKRNTRTNAAVLASIFFNFPTRLTLLSGILMFSPFGDMLYNNNNVCKPVVNRIILQMSDRATIPPAAVIVLSHFRGKLIPRFPTSSTVQRRRTQGKLRSSAAPPTPLPALPYEKAFNALQKIRLRIIIMGTVVKPSTRFCQKPELYR